MATYLHDDPMTISNDNLDTDSIIKKRSQKNRQEQQ